MLHTESHVKCGSDKKHQRKIHHRLCRSTIPNTTSTHLQVRLNESLLDKKPTKQCYMLSEEKAGEIGPKLEYSMQSLRYLIFQNKMQ